MDWPALCERLASHTHSDRATVWSRSLVPEAGLESARVALEETTEMRAILSEGFSLQRTLETRDAVETAARGSVIASGDLRTIASGAAAGNAAVRRIREVGGERLRERCTPFTPLPQLVSRIDEAIGGRGEVLDRASPALGRLRRGIVAAQAEARERTTAIARSSRYRSMLQDDVVTVREGRFVVPVKAEFAGEFKGIVHDSSASGQTFFVEPLETLEANNRLRSLRVQEEHEVTRILAELSHLVGTHAPQLEANAQVYAQLDLIHARARLAESMRAEPPALEAESMLAIVDGRHPLLDDRAVPQSLRLDRETRMLLISGPNMGGKTVTLKMAGLFVLMAYAGMHLPAAQGSSIGSFERLYADIGDDQSIAQNASTFSAHLRRIGEILGGAGPRTLILVDEIGSGTEPAAGAALAVALLESFLERAARTIATTHASEIKLFAQATPGVENASVRFDPKTYAPTFQLDLGAPGQSLAFPLARSMGIDPRVVERAENVLSSSERDYDRALDELAGRPCRGRGRTRSHRGGAAAHRGDRVGRATGARPARVRSAEAGARGRAAPRRSPRGLRPRAGAPVGRPRPGQGHRRTERRALAGHRRAPPGSRDRARLQATGRGREGPRIGDRVLIGARTGGHAGRAFRRRCDGADRLHADERQGRGPVPCRRRKA